MESRFNKVINAENRFEDFVSLDALDLNIEWCLQLAQRYPELYSNPSLSDEFLVLQHSKNFRKLFGLVLNRYRSIVRVDEGRWKQITHCKEKKIRRTKVDIFVSI